MLGTGTTLNPLAHELIDLRFACPWTGSDQLLPQHRLAQSEQIEGHLEAFGSS